MVPPDDGVNVVEQESAPVAGREQLAGEKPPARLPEKDTLPAGRVGDAVVSVTVAVQVVVLPGLIPVGPQVTDVCVERKTVKLADALSAGLALSAAKTVWAPADEFTGTVTEHVNPPDALAEHGVGLVARTVPFAPSHLIVTVELAAKYDPVTLTEAPAFPAAGDSVIAGFTARVVVPLLVA